MFRTSSVTCCPNLLSTTMRPLPAAVPSAAATAVLASRGTACSSSRTTSGLTCTCQQYNNTAVQQVTAASRGKTGLQVIAISCSTHAISRVAARPSMIGGCYNTFRAVGLLLCRNMPCGCLIQGRLLQQADVLLSCYEGPAILNTFFACWLQV